MLPLGFAPACGRRYRRALDLDVGLALGFVTSLVRARVLGAAFFLATFFGAPLLFRSAVWRTLDFALRFGFAAAFGFAAPLDFPATGFASRGCVSCACAAARRAIGTRNGEQET